jgi:hypothetical protein
MPARRGAVFAVPLTVGAIRAGVLGLYRGAPGPLPDRQLGDLLILADVATVMLLGSAHDDAEDGDGAALDGQARTWRCIAPRSIWPPGC